MFVADLIAGSSEPNVVLSVDTGGAHCCTVVQVFTFDPSSGSYTLTNHLFGDPLFQIEDLPPARHR